MSINPSAREHTFLASEKRCSITTRRQLQIDAEVFDEFLRAVLGALQEANNGPLVGLLAGCIEVSLALNVNITGAWPTFPKGLELLLARLLTELDVAGLT